MDEAIIERKLAELIDELRLIHAARESGPIFLARRNRGCQGKHSTTADGIQDSVDFLRLNIKYLMFDLEATRRENAYLRRLFDDKE